eukprot:203440-Alexandrium_andersonii.AAC.1
MSVQHGLVPAKMRTCMCVRARAHAILCAHERVPYCLFCVSMIVRHGLSHVTKCARVRVCAVCECACARTPCVMRVMPAQSVSVHVHAPRAQSVSVHERAAWVCTC